LASAGIDRTTIERGVVHEPSTDFTAELDQSDEGVFYEASDETLEAAAGIEDHSLVTIGPTIMVGRCC
jgi:hypothetical protein